jgi:hypothetical protein
MSGAKSPIWFWLAIAAVGGIVAVQFWAHGDADWPTYPGIPELDGASNSSLYKTVDDATPLSADEVQIADDAKFRFTLQMGGEGMRLKTIALTADRELQTETFNRLRSAVEKSDGSNDYTTKRFSISPADFRRFQQTLENERFVELSRQYIATNIQCGTSVTLTLETATITKSVFCSNHFPKKVLRIWKRLNAIPGREIPVRPIGKKPKPEK